MTAPQQKDPARQRFMVLTLLRFSGVALMLIGMANMVARTVEPADLIGGAIFIVGLLDSLILPRLLARKWRTPPAA